MAGGFWFSSASKEGMTITPRETRVSNCLLVQSDLKTDIAKLTRNEPDGATDTSQSLLAAREA